MRLKSTSTRSTALFNSSGHKILKAFIAITVLISSTSTYGFQLNDKVSLPVPSISLQDSIDYFLNSSDNLINLKKNDTAEFHLRKAYSLSKKKNDTRLIKKSGFKLLDFLFIVSNDYKEAINLSRQLYGYCFNIKDSVCMVETFKKLGAIKKRQYKYVEALEYYDKALAILNKTKDTLELWNFNVLKGNVYVDIGDLDLARAEYLKLLQILPKENFDYSYVISHINIGSTYEHPDSLIHYSKKALKNCSKALPRRECFLAYNNIAWAYTLKNDPKTSLAIIDENIDVSAIKQNIDDNLYGALHHTIGANHYLLGNYDKAIGNFKLALEGFKKDKNIANIIIAKEDLSKSYEMKGDLSSSLKLMKEIKSLNDEFDRIKIKREVAKIESRKLLKIKEQQISNLKQENQKIGLAIINSRKFNYFLGTFLLITISIVLFYAHRNRVKFHQINEELSLSRMKSLRSMMNPHFLFNSFSTLQNHILKKENNKANEYMTEFSGLIRKVLETSDSIYTSFNKEIELLKSYVNVEKGRFQNKFEVFFDVDNELVKLDPVIPSMIIQPYIENAIVHGFVALDNKHMLLLSFKKLDKTIKCIIKDNGIGRKKAEILKGKNNNISHLSVATRNTRDRLRILSKIGNETASVKINDLYDESGEASGTEVIITLPVRKNERT